MLGWTSLQPCPTQASGRHAILRLEQVSSTHDAGAGRGHLQADWTHPNLTGGQEIPFKNGVMHMDHGVDRPTSLPLSHRISLMDERVVVQLGFRTRPLRDGGGKPSPGRLVPPLRKSTGLTSMGQKIIDITSELNQAVQMSISCGEKNHPFSDELLKRIRQCLGATSEDGVAEAQPFFLTLISRLPKRVVTKTGSTH